MSQNSALKNRPCRTRVDRMGCLPFFHPTQVVFVDDERSFLDLFPLRFATRYPVSCYESAGDCIEAFSSGMLSTTIELNCWSRCNTGITADSTEQLFSLDQSMLFLRVFARDRFTPVSVLVVDYEMPEMSGIELCERLAELPCKKILLTGRADHDIAVDALNAGVIDVYLSKLSLGLDQRLDDAIRRFQVEFIRDAARLIDDALTTSKRAFWHAGSFCEMFTELCKSREIVEHYAVDRPNGFVLVDKDANGSLLRVLTTPELDAQAVSAQLSRAPAEVVQALRERRAALHFADESSLRVLRPEEWRDACIRLTPLPDRDDIFYSLIDRPDPYLVSPETVLGYNRYLQRLSR